MAAACRTRQQPAHDSLRARSHPKHRRRFAPRDRLHAPPAHPLRRSPRQGASRAARQAWTSTPRAPSRPAARRTNVMPTPAPKYARSHVSTPRTAEVGLGAAAHCSAQAMNNGVTGTMTVDVPASALPGDYAVLLIGSFLGTANCNPALSEDSFHYWPVGVYVVP